MCFCSFMLITTNLDGGCADASTSCTDGLGMGNLVQNLSSDTYVIRTCGTFVDITMFMRYICKGLSSDFCHLMQCLSLSLSV